MKTLSKSDFNKMKAEEIKKHPSFLLTSDGEELGIVIIGSVEQMHERLKALADLVDSGRSFK